MYLYMIICIIGSGGREHAICRSISISSKVSKIYCIPGNAGTQQLAENIDLDIDNFEKILKFLKLSKVDLVIVGPEKPLVNGIVDYLEINDSGAPNALFADIDAKPNPNANSKTNSFCRLLIRSPWLC